MRIGGRCRGTGPTLLHQISLRHLSRVIIYAAAGNHRAPSACEDPSHPKPTQRETYWQPMGKRANDKLDDGCCISVVYDTHLVAPRSFITD